jgi:hypothetical protein
MAPQQYQVFQAASCIFAHGGFHLVCTSGVITDTIYLGLESTTMTYYPPLLLLIASTDCVKVICDESI